MRFHVVNLGCKVNKAESDSMSAHLLATGNELVGLDEADAIIINTCTVTGDAEKKTRKVVRRALRENTHARVMVTGCAAAISPDFYRALDSRVEIIEKAAFLSTDPACRTGLAFPARPLDEIVAEVKALERAGIREVMLSGIDLGSYRFEKQALDALLSTLIEATHEMRFRISSVEPASLTSATIERIAQAEGRICRHLHLPLQSGSNKVLKEMNRPYSAEFYLRLCEDIYDALPTLALSTDIICGFPGETDVEFEETLLLRNRRDSRRYMPSATRCAKARRQPRDAIRSIRPQKNSVLKGSSRLLATCAKKTVCAASERAKQCSSRHRALV